MMSAGADQGSDEGLDSRKAGKRELSNSKRAAQNRAAQVRVSRGLFFVLRALSRRWVYGMRSRVRRWLLVKKNSSWVMGSLLCQFSCHPSSGYHIQP